MKLRELSGLTFARGDPVLLDQEVTSTVEGILGRKLARADPLRLFLRGIEAVILQQRLLIDESAKQNLLAYATGSNLEHLGALVGVERMGARAATVTMRLTLSAPRTRATSIASGTRFSTSDGVMFGLDGGVIFSVGETVKEATATCQSVGVIGNDYEIGEINSIVDPQPYLQSALNITKSEGGSEVETDDAFRERIHEAPEGFSVAGPTGAYRAFAMSVSPLISDVSVISPSPGVVEVRPLLKGGVLPDAEMLNAVYEYLNDKSRRPLTDLVRVLAPSAASYTIDLEYWINRSDAPRALSIEAAAESAVEEYVAWQRECLGRDINPSELIYRLKAAGVKRANVYQPLHRAIEETEAAIPTSIAVLYRGLEDD